MLGYVDVHSKIQWVIGPGTEGFLQRKAQSPGWLRVRGGAAQYAATEFTTASPLVLTVLCSRLRSEPLSRWGIECPP